jgi:hypothetical protein
MPGLKTEAVAWRALTSPDEIEALRKALRSILSATAKRDDSVS